MDGMMDAMGMMGGVMMGSIGILYLLVILNLVLLSIFLIKVIRNQRVVPASDP